MQRLSSELVVTMDKLGDLENFLTQVSDDKD